MIRKRKMNVAIAVGGGYCFKRVDSSRPSFSVDDIYTMTEAMYNHPTLLQTTTERGAPGFKPFK